MSEIKIAMVNTELTRGGAARMAAGLVDSINQYSINCSAKIYHCENNEVNGSQVGLKRPISRYLNAGLARIGGSFQVADLGVSNQLIRETENADVLHIHNLHGYYLNFTKLLSVWRKRPVVWTWHDMWGATGRCGFSFDCDSWREGCLSCSHTEYYPSAWSDKADAEFQKKSTLFFSMKNLTIVSPSQWLADIAIERGFSSSRVKVIPNPVDTGKFQHLEQSLARVKLGLPEDEFIVLFLASDCGDERKGYSDFAQLCSKNSLNGVAVGKEPSTPAGHIRHIGVIKDQSILNQYCAAADVMVIPTYADNYPNTVIEALASGTPVWGYDEGGVASQLDLPECGVVTKGDWQALGDRVKRLSEKKLDFSNLSSELSNRARLRWSPEIVVEQYLNLYQNVQEKNCTSFK